MSLLSLPGTSGNPILSVSKTEVELFPPESAMTKTAFIGDVHGYAPALKMALKWCRTENVEAIVGLGDFVDGYDADEECLDLIREHFSVCVRGNHDEDHAMELLPESAQWLGELPQSIEFGGWLVTHSSPRVGRQDEYIRSSVDAWNCFEDCEFNRCIVGHTHQPMLYRFSDARKFDSEALDATGNGQVLEPGYRYFLVNPSLAYNRTGQQNPGFSVFDADTQKLRIVYLDLPQIERKF